MTHAPNLTYTGRRGEEVICMRIQLRLKFTWRFPEVTDSLNFMSGFLRRDKLT